MIIHGLHFRHGVIAPVASAPVLAEAVENRYNNQAYDGNDYKSCVQWILAKIGQQTVDVGRINVDRHFISADPHDGSPIGVLNDNRDVGGEEVSGASELVVPRQLRFQLPNNVVAGSGRACGRKGGHRRFETVARGGRVLQEVWKLAEERCPSWQGQGQSAGGRKAI